jgi:hypothetical protein
MTKEQFDEAVKSLRGSVAPKAANKKKTDCTPEEWAANLDYAVECNRRWRTANLEKCRRGVAERSRVWRAKHPDRVREKSRKRVMEWRAKYPERYRQYLADRLKSDPDYKMRANLRRRINRAIKGDFKRGSAVRDMGCTVAEFWTHMESLFRPGMTRENMGTVWEIDHIYPLAKADLRGSRVEFLAVNNWRNLQPLTPEENNAKKDTITPESQALFDQLKAEFAA